MATDKQERTVIHLELGAEHHYFGSIKALCDHFGKEQIGITYKSLANIGIAPDKPYRNKYCSRMYQRAYNKRVYHNLSSIKNLISKDTQ